ncbi:hypothetical protein F5Y04DRAFT_262986 [Hypomontagnella monticulosa]|nr:hypothetical protein F5Y04DRAFT_262986 [Hypomontagnella monticulosa]
MSSSAYSGRTYSGRTPVVEYEPFKPVALQPVNYLPVPWQSPNQRSWDKAKLALRIVSTVLAVPLLGISIFGWWSPTGFNFYPILGTALGAAVCAYDLADYIVMCARRRKSGIQPKVSLGFELIISFGGLAISILLISSAVGSWGWHSYYDGSSGVPISDYVVNGYFWFGMAVGASVLGTLISLIHFVLFVRDCVEVDRQRKAERYGRWMASTIPVAPQYQQPQPQLQPQRMVNEPISPETMVGHDSFEYNTKFRMDIVKHD